MKCAHELVWCVFFSLRPNIPTTINTCKILYTSWVCTMYIVHIHTVYRHIYLIYWYIHCVHNTPVERKKCVKNKKLCTIHIYHTLQWHRRYIRCKVNGTHMEKHIELKRENRTTTPPTTTTTKCEQVQAGKRIHLYARMKSESELYSLVLVLVLIRVPPRSK